LLVTHRTKTLNPELNSLLWKTPIVSGHARHPGNFSKRISMDAREFLMKTLKFPIIKPYNVTFFLNDHNSPNTQAHISEKSARQQFEGNMSMSAVRGL
jgi:hypothetical protein